MPRTLPWAVDAAKRKEPKAASSSPLPKRKHDSTDEEDLVDEDLNDIRPSTPKLKQKRPANRTPSTSPPPAPPSAKFMREGYHADDVYLMVEDEFLSTAKMYTQHIHRAEYVRLKKLARSRGVGTLDAIHRPTDGKTKQSNALRMRLEAQEKDESIKNGIRRVEHGEEEGSSEGEDEYMHDPQLAGLMTRDSGLKRDLSSLAKAKANTRAAAGFQQSPRNVEKKRDALAIPDPVLEEEETEDKDDLDRAPVRKAPPSKVSERKRITRHEAIPVKTVSPEHRTSANGSGTFKRFAKSPVKQEPARKPSFEPISRPKFKRDKDPSSPPPKEIEFPSFASDTKSMPDHLAKRRAERQRKEREEKRKANRADDIPTFLI